MKKQIILLLLIMTTIGCNSKNIEIGKTLNDSIYFSIKSPCNIIIKITNKENAILNVNGKISNGKISKSKFDKGYFNITENNKQILMFAYEGSKIIIVNQQYQFGCESSKVIEVDKYVSDKQLLEEFKKYEKDSDYAFDDIDLINDKAYYLEELNCYKTSEYILGKILLLKPDRVVAWLNIADVYWKQGKKELAKKSYQKYISLMNSQKKDLKKIPKRVYDRNN